MNIHPSFLPPVRVSLALPEAKAERQRERERVAGLRNLDGSAPDLDPRDDFVRMVLPTVDGSAAIERQGWFQEKPASDLGPACLEYSVSSTVQLPGQSALHTTVDGWHNPANDIWFASRTYHTEEGTRREELTLNGADLASSYKQVWLLTN